jgi:mono/diheme cytochrome c family protein
MRSLRTDFRLLLLALTALLLLLAGCSLASEPIPAGPVQTGPLPGELPSAPGEQPRFASGATIFQENCAGCHGPAGAGDGEFAAQLASQGASLPNFQDIERVRSRSPQDWFSVISNGTIAQGGLMPPWSGSLSVSQRWDAAYYLYTLSMPGDPAEVLAQGQTVYDEFLAGCYGPAGAAIGVTDLSQAVGLSLGTISGEYINANACPASADLSEEARLAAAYYVLTLPADTDLTAPAAVVEEPAPEASADTPAEDSAEAPLPAEDEPLDLSAGVVRGVISDSKGVPQSGLSVELEGLVMGMEGGFSSALKMEATSGADGSYRFENVPFDLIGGGYIVTVIYQDVTYGNGTLLDGASLELDLPVTVFPSTTDPAVITIDSLHVILRETGAGGIAVAQLYVFSNSSEGVYINTVEAPGEGRVSSVAIGLSAGAENIQFEDDAFGSRFIPVGDLYYDTREVYPGAQSHSALVQYNLPGDRTFDLDIALPYAAAQITVLAPDGLKLRSPLLTEGQSEIIEGQPYTLYSAHGLPAGEHLTFDARLGAGGFNLTSILAAGLALVLAGGGAYLYLNRDRLPRPETGESGAAGAENLTPLIQAIRELDAAYAAGGLNRIDYETDRAALKARIAEEGL